MTLELTPLRKALEQFNVSVEYLHSPHAARDSSIRRQFRNSVIQCFEFIYGVAIKMIRRQFV